MTHHLLAEGELLAAVYSTVHPVVTAAQEAYGRLPSLKTEEFLDADPFARIAALLVLAEAYVVCDPHQVIRERLRAVSSDVHGGDVEHWAALANRTPRSAVLAARAEAVTPVRCTRSSCKTVLSVPHPLPDLSAVLCHLHRDEVEAAA